VVSGISVFFIIASILTFCLKTLDNMRVTVLRNVTSLNVDDDDAGEALTLAAGNETSAAAAATTWRMEAQRTDPHPALFYIECICNAWFTFEIIIRFVVAHNKAVFVRKPARISTFLFTYLVTSVVI